MPPKRQHDKRSIEEAAFAIARERGLANLSARSIAQRLGCSTSPIYSLFDTMAGLEDAVCERSTMLMLSYQQRKISGSPLLDLCLGYVLFAREEKQLFRDMFLDKRELSPHSREMREQALERLAGDLAENDPDVSALGPPARRELLDLLWTYTHGLAAQINIGAVDLPDQEAVSRRLRLVIEPLLASRSG